jgi:hypothetical protein
VHCHRDFWYDDFIGVCTSRVCSSVPGFEQNLSTMEYDPKIGPRKILLREETRHKYATELEKAPIEDILTTKSHTCKCHHRFYFYACPMCRRLMPRMRKEELKKTIAPAGIGKSGKTVFMTALIERLLNRGIVKPNINVVSNFAEQDDFYRFREKYDILFKGKRLFAPTVPGEIPAPYLLRTTTEEKGVQERKFAHTLWYDFSGETFEKAAATDSIMQYYSAVGGIFFFIDPSNSSNVVETLNIRPNHEDGADPLRDLSVISMIHSLLVKTGGNENAPRQKLIAVIVNKADLFKGKGFSFFGDDSMVWQKSPHRDAGAFCLDDFKEVNREVEEYVRIYHSNIHGQLKLFLNDAKDNIGYFAVSPLGQTPDSNDELDTSIGINPMRVEDPFYWMLWKMGNLPAIGEEVFLDREDNHPGTGVPQYPGEAPSPKNGAGSTELF